MSDLKKRKTIDNQKNRNHMESDSNRREMESAGSSEQYGELGKYVERVGEENGTKSLGRDAFHFIFHKENEIWGDLNGMCDWASYHLKSYLYYNFLFYPAIMSVIKNEKT